MKKKEWKDCVSSLVTELTEGVAEENKSMGQARVGGPYKLIDFDGKEVTQDTYAGKHTLVCSLKRDAKTDLFRVYSVSGYLSRGIG